MVRGPAASVRVSLKRSAVLGILCFTAPAIAAGTPIEFAVKAAFIYKFAPYVDWPASAFPSPNTPFTICVVGEDPVSAMVDQTATGQRVNMRAVIVRHLAAVTRGADCNVLYIADTNPQAVADDLSALRGAPVLTITDADRTPRTAGIIGFTIRDNHVRFNVDDAAAAENGLTISSKLLSLANSVKHRS